MSIARRILLAGLLAGAVAAMTGLVPMRAGIAAEASGRPAAPVPHAAAGFVPAGMEDRGGIRW